MSTSTSGNKPLISLIWVMALTWPFSTSFKQIISLLVWSWWILLSPFKGCVRYIFTSLFLSVKHSTCETRNNAFYFTSKALSVLEKKFSILDIQISWGHQMPEHKTRNICYWVAWEVIWSVYVMLQKKKFYQKTL